MPSPQARYWILTVPQHLFMPYLPPGCSHVSGQLEIGVGGFVHWQLCVSFIQKVTLARVRETFGSVHAEPSRSDAVRAYVWKEDTRVHGTQFELGTLPFRRNAKSDWDAILLAAKTGDISTVPADVQVRCYNQLRRIGSDYVLNSTCDRKCTAMTISILCILLKQLILVRMNKIHLRTNKKHALTP